MFSCGAKPYISLVLLLPLSLVPRGQRLLDGGLVGGVKAVAAVGAAVGYGK